MRGCPYPCSFCMYGKTPPSRKEVSVVVEELADLLGRGLSVELIDPTFTTYTKRAKEILRALADRNYSGTMWFEAYPDSIDEELVDLCKRTNVWAVEMGFQTLSAEGLKAVARPQNLEKFERAVQLLRSAGMRFWVDVIYGLPKTTPADFAATMDYLVERGVPQIDVYRLIGLPGSPMMNDLDTYGLVFSSTPPYELLSSHTFSLDDLLFCERFTRTYYSLRRHLNNDLLRSLSRMAGGLSSLVQFVIDHGAAESKDADEMTRVLADFMRTYGRRHSKLPA